MAGFGNSRPSGVFPSRSWPWCPAGALFRWPWCEGPLLGVRCACRRSGAIGGLWALWAGVAIPDGSSSDAPVISPGPQLTKSGCRISSPPCDQSLLSVKTLHRRALGVHFLNDRVRFVMVNGSFAPLFFLSTATALSMIKPSMMIAVRHEVCHMFASCGFILLGGDLMKYGIAWLLGVPVSVLVLIYLLTHVL